MEHEEQQHVDDAPPVIELHADDPYCGAMLRDLACRLHADGNKTRAGEVLAAASACDRWRRTRGK